MFLPTLDTEKQKQNIQTKFYGLNHTLNASESEFYDMQNMTSSYFPALSTRNQRNKLFENTYGGLTAVYFDDKFVRTQKDAEESTKANFIILDPNKSGSPVYGTVSANENKIIGFGGHYVLWPEKVMFERTVSDEGYTCLKKDLAVNYVANADSTDSLHFSWCDMDGTEYEDVHSLSVAPTNPTDGMLWCDISNRENIVLKKYSESLLMWIPLSPTYTKISFAKQQDDKYIGNHFEIGDVVQFKGLYNDSEVTTEFKDKKFIIVSKTDTSLVVEAVLSAPYVYTTPIRIVKEVPDLDFVCEHNNRLWGCSSKENLIYASKLGDPSNWYCYQGISTDSYTSNIGAPGDFTGCVSYRGYIIFFKENCIVIVSGNLPSSFTVTQINCSGVMKGSEDSIAIVNNVLYYHSPNGIMAYTAEGMPQLISQNIGKRLYRVKAGKNHNKLYVFSRIMVNHAYTDNYEVYVFDTQKSLWHKEDTISLKLLANHYDNLIRVDTNDVMYDFDTAWEKELGGTEQIYTIKPLGEFEWFAETGDYLMTTPDNKFISKIQLNVQLEKGAELKIYIQTDSDGIWKDIYKLKATKKMIYTIPVLPIRCHHFRLKFKGKGDFKLYSISKVTEGGSELW